MMVGDGCSALGILYILICMMKGEAALYQICIGLLFFAMLPFANNCLDYLVRTNIADELQGRVWGIIGFLSQIGYVVAYGTAGLAADGLANWFQITVGRGAANVILTAGILLSLTALVLYRIKSVRLLERGSKQNE